MRYAVTLGTRTLQVDLERGDGGWNFCIDGQPLAADLVRIGAEVVSVLAGERSITFHCSAPERSEAGMRVHLVAREGEWTAEVADPRRPPASAAPPIQGGVRVAASIAGKVVKLRVAAGDTIAAGQALLVLEAMKMQNEVRSPKAGTIVRVAVAPGDTVLAGALLMEIE